MSTSLFDRDDALNSGLEHDCPEVPVTDTGLHFAIVCPFGCRSRGRPMLHYHGRLYGPRVAHCATSGHSRSYVLVPASNPSAALRNQSSATDRAKSAPSRPRGRSGAGVR